MTNLYWKCGCGKVILKIDGLPWNEGVCHCHSCVASCRFIDEKYADNEKHTSAIVNGGSAGACFMPNNVNVLSEDIPIGCLKVGPSGRAIRKYVKCCGTQLGMVENAFWALSINSLYKDKDGKERYYPAKPLINQMKKYSFDSDKVPEPSVNMVTLGTVLRIIRVMLNPFGPSIDKAVLSKFEVDPALADEVPITWE